MVYYQRIRLFRFVAKKKESYLSVLQKKSLRRWEVKSNHVSQCKQADVPVVPGITTNIETAEEAIEIAKQIGYPLMLKASAGGGGIGMQLMETEQTLTKAFESNKTRAQNFFGNGEMYLERYIADAHHIEIQLLADTHGNTVYLWERECSVQRRNQK